jgi:hypothetical protein
MCGKVNSDDLDTCQYCQARLKPLIAGAPGGEDLLGGLERFQSGGEAAGKAEAADWLQSLRQDDGGEGLFGEGQDPEEESADWGAMAEESGLPAAGGDVPDWLSSLRRSDQQPGEAQKAGETASEQPLAEADGEEDWISSLTRSNGATGLVRNEMPADESPTLPVEDPPEWLTRVRALRQADEAGEQDEPGQSLPPAPQEQAEGTPDWLAEMEKGASISEPPSQPAREEPEVVFDWLNSQGKAASAAPAANETEEPTGETGAPVAPFTFDEESNDLYEDMLPEWLAGVSAQAAEAEKSPEGEAGLAPADLPGWLEAMRPVESAALGAAAAAEEREAEIEGSGPLAGLRGILPADTDAAMHKKPPAYAIKLQVSEIQQAHADLLKELIQAEGTTPPLPAPPVISTRFALRMLILALIFAAAIWPAMTASQMVALPQISGEVFELRKIIDATPGSGTALVAVDYEAGLSGEMDAAAAAVLDHLMIKGVYLTLVSTSPTGPLQGERLLRRVNALGRHDYASPAQYTNLGYIPGGAAGLKGFATDPRGALPFALDGGRGWEAPRLAALQGLDGFDLVLVITEDADTARAWIEQAAPALGDTPLTMVVSAQAEPLVRPYYQALPKQVDGFLAGLAGAAQYESAMPRSGLARKLWDAFSYAGSAAVLVIAIGGAVALLFSAWQERRRVRGEAGL